MVMQGLNTSIIGNAVEQNLIEINVINIRDFTKDRHKKVDDYPYGGGAGMVMQAQPIYDAWKSIVAQVGYEPRCAACAPTAVVPIDDVAYLERISSPYTEPACFSRSVFQVCACAS